MVQIITDSSTLYTPDEAKALGFESVPLCVNIGDFEGRDLLIDMDDYYDRIRKGGIPKSSQPPIGDVVDVYEKYEGHEIINISMADGLSGTYQSACSAKEIIEWLENIKEKSESFLIPQDFDFLRRGGRLTPVAALGSVLKLKPIMTLTEDCKRLDKFAVKRTMKSAVDTVISHLKTRNLDSRHILYISHADALDDAKKIMAQMKETFAQLEVKILELSPVFVAQGGPKCVAIQYIER